MDNNSMGIILKGVGGLYTVKTAGELFTCKARGIFRKDKATPLVGDNVKIGFSEQGEPVIEEILPRKNELLRPPISNIDRLFIVLSVCDPVPNLYNVDRLIAIAEHKGIEPFLVISKVDLGDSREFCRIYEKAGFPVVEVSAKTGEGIDMLGSMLHNKVSAFAGNSGVGKSTLLNALFEDLNLETGEISRRLQRGRHTTRHLELFPIEQGGFVADTPGFSAIEIERGVTILRHELPLCFREFSEYLGRCKFNSCTHTNDLGCAVIEAVGRGEISPLRYQSYLNMYDEVKNIREWEKK